MNTAVDFWKRTKAISNGCIEWQGAHLTRGYGNVYYRGGYYLAHRVAWQLVNGRIPHKINVLHSCDNPKCVNVTHLSLGTQVDNLNQCVARGRRAIGEKVWNSVLTKADIHSIRSMIVKGVSQEVIGRLFNVHRVTISKINRRLLWKHVI